MFTITIVLIDKRVRQFFNKNFFLANTDLEYAFIGKNTVILLTMKRLQLHTLTRFLQYSSDFSSLFIVQKLEITILRSSIFMLRFSICQDHRGLFI